MNQIGEAFQLLFTSDIWSGPTGFGMRLGEHVWYTVAAVAIALVIALPIGLAIGHFHRFRNLSVATTGMVRALPTLGLLTLVSALHGPRAGGPDGGTCNPCDSFSTCRGVLGS